MLEDHPTVLRSAGNRGARSPQTWTQRHAFRDATYPGSRARTPDLQSIVAQSDPKAEVAESHAKVAVVGAKVSPS